MEDSQVYFGDCSCAWLVPFLVFRYSLSVSSVRLFVLHVRPTIYLYVGLYAPFVPMSVHLSVCTSASLHVCLSQ